jgi:crotonobetainyl-CoA:carnitine CoA-transferase CaiB-like acyl-CoA transferase
MLTDPHGPLHGVRALDASRVLAGPFCGQLLGDLGAEVIKIERPGGGDETRTWGPPFAGDLSAYFLSCNRNKRSVALDLGKPQGLDLFCRLVEKCDILLENFRAASANKLGLGPAKLRARNPRLIVCSISGYGRTGPMSDMPGYDFAIQGLSGLMSITGPVEGPPSKVGVAVSDVLTGLYAAAAVLACLHARATSGHGYAIDVALLDCAVAAQVNVAQAYLTSGAVPPRQGNAHLQIVPYQAFATKPRDESSIPAGHAAGDWLILAIGNDSQWQRFCLAVERPDWTNDARFSTNTLRVQHRDALVPQLEALFRTQPAGAWRELLQRADIPHAPVWDYSQLFASEQAQARGLRVTVRDPDGKPVDLLGSPLRIAGATLPNLTLPPRLGQDTAEVLQHLLGTDESTLTKLRQNGVIG